MIIAGHMNFSRLESSTACATDETKLLVNQGLITSATQARKVLLKTIIIQVTFSSITRLFTPVYFNPAQPPTNSLIYIFSFQVRQPLRK